MIDNVSIEGGTVADPAAGVGLDTAEQISAFEQILYQGRLHHRPAALQATAVATP